jgi:hypothetical protein
MAEKPYQGNFQSNIQNGLPDKNDKNYKSKPG